MIWMESINIFCIPSNINLIELSNLSAIFITFITRFIGLIDESITNILQCGSSLYTYLVLIDFYSFSNNFAKKFYWLCSTDLLGYYNTVNLQLPFSVYRNININSKRTSKKLVYLCSNYICTFGWLL